MGYTKVIQSGNLTEVYRYEKDLRAITYRRSRSERERRYLSERRARDRALGFNVARREDNIRRSSKYFKRLVRSNLIGDQAPALLTLTIYELFSLKASRILLKEFFRRMKDEYGDLRYIAVPEWQKRGAVHFHVLIWGFPVELPCKGRFVGKKKFRRFIHKCDPHANCERQTRNIQRLWLRGFCDCMQTDGRPALAGYLAKYMSKSMRDQRLGGEKAYSCSRGIVRPVSFGTHASMAYIDEEVIGVDSVPRHVREFGSQWLGRVHYQCYDNS